MPVYVWLGQFLTWQYELTFYKAIGFPLISNYNQFFTVVNRLNDFSYKWNDGSGATMGVLVGVVV